ncbi:AraC family L-rhamnose operon regulatory protein RhaS [Paenibacillus phyllosphaerae]|uniref:AraC family L-rhamnose operon regulatory protein RhaS n=1 Tax=Paenibacillus phyllosphaerae TaxID=274593 RepID=A0A7W5B3I8_9BACL|nr:helix-turn-helix domain-containing protein [Paenibacillus phyllosphaerae]MBB3113763.1 AraC family L-rhamnose operon regulatory protein RhaS [Paenibacillus phyllosphaerae]
MTNVFLRWFTNDDQTPFFIQYGGHEEDTELHRHADFSELVIVLSGNATHIVNTDASFIKKGDVFVINGTTPHAYKDPANFKICNIMYRSEMLQYAGPDLRTSSGYQTLFILEPYYRSIHPYRNKLSLPVPSLESISPLIAAMVEEYENQAQGYQTMLLSQFIGLVVYLSRQFDLHQEANPSNLHHVASAISYMEDHYLEPLTLQEIADHANISARHLNRIFRSYYETTPIAYLQRLRLERAYNLLKQTSLPVTQVSYECGFNDSNYFTRQFTKSYGVSPRTLRKSSGQSEGPI